jgi:hypothetical protein
MAGDCCIVDIGELQLPVSLRQGAATACTVASCGSSNSLYFFHRRVETPRFVYAMGRILSPRSVPMLFVSFMARSHCLTTSYIIYYLQRGDATSLYEVSIFYFFNLLFLSRFCVSIDTFRFWALRY